MAQTSIGVAKCNMKGELFIPGIMSLWNEHMIIIYDIITQEIGQIHIHDGDNAGSAC